MSHVVNNFEGLVQVTKVFDANAQTPTRRNAGVRIASFNDKTGEPNWFTSAIASFYVGTNGQLSFAEGEILNIKGNFLVNKKQDGNGHVLNINVASYSREMVVEFNGQPMNIRPAHHDASAMGQVSSIRTGVGNSGQPWASFSLTSPLYFGKDSVVKGHTYLNVSVFGELPQYIVEGAWVVVGGTLFSEQDREDRNKSYYKLRANRFSPFVQIEPYQPAQQQAPAAPAQPNYGQPAQPGYGQPTAPVTPDFGRPAPSQPAYGQPQTPSFMPEQSPFGETSPLDISDDDLPF